MAVAHLRNRVQEDRAGKIDEDDDDEDANTENMLTFFKIDLYVYT